MRKVMLYLIMIVFIFSLIVYQYMSIREQKSLSLREVATQNNFLIGASVSAYPFFNDDKYKSILKNEFNLLTIENDMKFSFIHPEKDIFNFHTSDLMVHFAEENNMKIRGHTLVWHASLPDWITEGEFSKEELSTILKSHIQAVVGRYKGKVYAWDVVNEAFNDDGTLRDSIWMQIIGPEYIELAFQWAREADPNALLFYNDFNNEGFDKKSNAIFEMAKDLKARGIPIDGVGFQLHSNIAYEKDYQSIKENFKRYKDIALQVQITEMDVMIQNIDKPYSERLQLQADMYDKTLNVCLTSANCTAFVTWGVTDNYSWIPSFSGNDDAPLLFDKEYKRKSSHTAVYRVLQEQLE